MYTISDAVEIGKAQDLILSTVKGSPAEDDINPNTLSGEEAFDE